MIFMWHKKISEGREANEKDEREEDPKYIKTDKKVQKAIEIITIWTHHKSEKLIRKYFTQDQKDARKENCLDVHERLNEEPHLFKEVITLN